MACAVTPTSAPATITSRRLASTPTWGCSPATPSLTGDVINLFHSLTGRSLKRDYAKLLVAPVNMRDRFLAMIQREIDHLQAGRPARILAKMNQLEDRQVCEALIRASQAGVEIELLIRGLCVLAAWRAGCHRAHSCHLGRWTLPRAFPDFLLSERDGGSTRRFILYRLGRLDGAQFIGTRGSRDAGRVASLTGSSMGILQIMRHDHRQAWDLRPDGSYVQRLQPAEAGDGPEILGTQQTLMNSAARRGEAELESVRKC